MGKNDTGIGIDKDAPANLGSPQTTPATGQSTTIEADQANAAGLANQGAGDGAAGDGTGAAEGSQEGANLERGPIDPTDPEQAGDAVVMVDQSANRDHSDPEQNANVGYNADGVVVSNQQGEQVNTVQATDDERAEAQEIKAADAEGRDPYTDPEVTNQTA